MSDMLREHFLSLIGRVRANGSFPDAPLLAVYDALRTQLAQVTARRDVLEHRIKAVDVEYDKLEVYRMKMIKAYTAIEQQLATMTAERDEARNECLKMDHVCLERDAMVARLEEQYIQLAAYAK